MNILLVNHYAGSLELGMEYRPYFFAREWVRMGHRVRIIAASESHLRQIKPSLYGQKIAHECIDGIEYVWLRTLVYKRNSIKRVINILSFVYALYRYNKEILDDFDLDVVVLSSVYNLEIYPLFRLARQHGVKLIFEVRDLWPLSPIELGGLSRWNPFMLLIQHAENYYCHKADIVASVLPSSKDHLVQHGMEPSKFVHVPNGVVISDWELRKPLSENEAELIHTTRSQYEFVVGYAGAHGVANALRYLIEAAELLRHENIGFILVGQGQEKVGLKQLSLNKALKNIMFLDAVERSKIPTLLEQFDALYIGWNKHPLYRFGVSPNKLIDYMMAGIPVVHSVAAANDLIAESGCGASCEAENSEAIAKAILNLKTMTRKERRDMGKKGKEYVIEHHDYRKLAEKYINIFKNTRAH